MEEWLSYNRKAYTVHTGDTPGAPGPGARGYCTIRHHMISSTQSHYFEDQET